MSQPSGPRKPARRHPLPPLSSPTDHRESPLIALLAALAYPAFVVALWGIASLLLNREVIDYADAGPLLGPLVVVVGTVVTAGALWRSWRGARSPLLAPASGVIAYLAMVLTAGLGYLVGGTRAVSGLEVLAHFALSPFIVGAAVISGLTVLLVQLAQSFDRRGR
jgi:hypothetical protein